MMVLSHPSTPQHRTAPRSLWSSPAFSDYFSGNDDNHSPGLMDGAKITPLQQRILIRLNEIGQQVLRAESGDQTPSILDAELDHIQQVLNAPESQSRAPAEMADSGLFIDDDDVEENISKFAVDKEIERKARELQEGHEVVLRISNVTKQLQQRYVELQDINELATSRLQSAADEIIGLRSENEHFHRDLSDIYNTMLALKMQLNMLEAQAAPHMKSEAGKSLREDVERWKLGWKDVEQRLSSRKHFYEHTSPDTLGDMNTVFGNGMSSSMHSSVDWSPPVYRSKLTIKRPGLIANPHSDPFFDQQAVTPLDDRVEEESVLERGMEGLKENENAKRKDSKVEQPDEDDKSIVSNEETFSLLEAEEEPPQKTAWQELWDGLTEYAGILDYSD